MAKKTATSKTDKSSSVKAHTKTVTNSADSRLQKKSVKQDLKADTRIRKKAEGVMWMKNGKMMVMKNGKIEVMKKNFIFPRGIKITIDGYAIIPLKEGTIVDDKFLWMNNYANNGIRA